MKVNTSKTYILAIFCLTTIIYLSACKKRPMTYLTYQPNNSVTVSISNDITSKKVMVTNGNITAEYDWDYDLTVGEPIIKVDRRKNFQDSVDALYIILPTKKVEPILNVDEICGTPHIINLSTLEEHPFSDEIDIYNDLTSIEFSEPNDTTVKNLYLSISPTDTPSFSYTFYYPGIQIPPDLNYEVIFEKTKHFSHSLLEYQRVGFSFNNEIIWLGTFCDDITDSNTEEFVFLPYENIQFSEKDGYSKGTTLTREEQLIAGKMIALLPDDALDLDDDGEKDIISYRSMTTDYTRGNSIYSLTVNNSTVEYVGDNVAPTIYGSSLDGKTLQLIIYDNGPSADPTLNIYHYTGSDLKYSGTIPSYGFSLTDNGIIANCESYHIQCYSVPFKFEYTNGEIKIIEQDFYPQGNTVTVLRDVPLYKEKNDTIIGITLKTGSEVIIVGSDLKEWVYIQDITSGEYGWLRTKDDYNNCLIPGGEAVPAAELFDGLYFYG